MPVTSSPRIETSPSSGISSPAMTRSSVDFPLPLGPSSAVRDPLAIASETSSSATCLPKRFDTWRTAIDIRDLLVCAWLEDVHGDERDDREQRQHERGRVRRHQGPRELLLVGAHLPEDRHDLADDERELYEHGRQHDPGRRKDDLDAAV